MVLNYIWVAFFVIAFIVALCKLLFMGDTEIFTELVNSTFDSSKTAFEISLGLTGILSLWLGIMKIGENSGMINALSRWLSPVFCRLFPEIPKGPRHLVSHRRPSRLSPAVRPRRITELGKSRGNNQGILPQRMESCQRKQLLIFKKKSKDTWF